MYQVGCGLVKCAENDDSDSRYIRNIGIGGVLGAAGFGGVGAYTALKESPFHARHNYRMLVNSEAKDLVLGKMKSVGYDYGLAMKAARADALKKVRKEYMSKVRGNIAKQNMKLVAKGLPFGLLVGAGLGALGTRLFGKKDKKPSDNW